MAFNIDETIDDMIGAISGIVSDEWPEVRGCVEDALKAEKDALENIATARLNNEITDEDLTDQLEDEKVALEAALLACLVRAKAMAQKAANAAIDVLRAAIIELL